MRDQTTARLGGITSARRPKSLAERASDDCQANDELGQRPVAVLSAAVMGAVRRACRESRADLAVRAGVAPDVVDAAEDGTRPTWALSYDEFTALAEAISALNPGLRTLFETAAACDLLMSCILDGDQVMATDVLSDAASRELAKALFGLLLISARQPVSVPLLGGIDVALLRNRAEALACSGSPDAWIGAEIVSLCGDAS
jgi:hypothetical protein